MAIAYLKSGKEARVLQGNPWVFRSEIDRVSGAWEPGDVVSVNSARGRTLCRGFAPYRVSVGQTGRPINLA